MRRTFTALLLIAAATSARPQGVTDYYRLPESSARSRRPGPDWNAAQPAARKVSWERLMARYGDAYTRSRWYVGAEGLIRTDQSYLDHTFNGLIDTESATKLTWGATVGWVSRERWAVEAGYSRTPVHNSLLISNGSSPLSFRFENKGNGLVLRGKRRILFGDKPAKGALDARTANRAAFWLGAGLWAIPNAAETVSRMRFLGYVQRGGPRSQRDTLQLITDTQISSNWAGLLEASAEYTVRLGGHAELGAFVRRHWGLSSSIRTNVAYQINGNEPQRAVISSDGSGWSFGLTLRYVYGLRYDVRKMPGVFKLKGNHPEPQKKKRRPRLSAADGYRL